MTEQSKLEQFVAEYAKQLPIAVEKYPADYPWRFHEGLPTEVVAGRMAEAIRRDTYNHDGHAFRLTCKALGIKHTRKAIEQFIGRRLS